ncbi:MAG: molybdopterin guanine dinucleotide-containing S/N-oxide reductase [Rhizobiaceae bacterium]|nr:molybdopterin guanine dinucleotide-containing S/N-oxide reductase [Rhizobiaceae bacterium]
MGNRPADFPLTSNHWGTYGVEAKDGKLVALHDFSEDPSPSPIGHGIVDVIEGPTRIAEPMVRKGWLENGPGSTSKRGNDAFVRIGWDEAERLVAEELKRVIGEFGNEAIYAGSYGWASAGRFHHAQSQIHRFLNCIGGYTRSRDTYSFAAAEVLMPHVLGGCREFMYPGNSWQSIIENTDLIVAFGGIPVKNGQIAQGGCGRHRQPDAIREAAKAGVNFVNISPLQSDMMPETNSEWWTPRPSTDAALLLALAHTMMVEGLHDQDFLNRYTVGFETFSKYLDGSKDGVVKSADWAAEICAVSAEKIRDLARRMAAGRTMLSVSWSLTRQDHGEQPFWAAIALASMIGQIGLPGGGISFGLSAVNSVGNEFTVVPGAALPQGTNPVESFIPVARISDLLLNPGAEFDYNGKRETYPDIKLVWWAGGNPFHHHQDLNRMRRAWQKPDTVISNEWCWNALARHSDIVLPCTVPVERHDIALTPRDGFVVFMERGVEPAGEARDDYEIFSGIARRLGVEDAFTEGRNVEEWVQHLYERSIQKAASKKISLPTYPELRAMKWFELEKPPVPAVTFREFRADPDLNPLNTPSGKIEIRSDTIASFEYEDCPAHPTWFEPLEWLGNSDRFPLHMISNQPSNKLHSQLDHGSVSRRGKKNKREPVHINPEDARSRNINEGDVVRVFNDRGACYCGAVLDDAVMQSVVCVSTGAWLDLESQDDVATCKHGNPNMLTPDKGTSRLAQGPIAHSCLVEIELAENAPPVAAFEPPEIIDKIGSENA